MKLAFGVATLALSAVGACGDNEKATLEELGQLALSFGPGQSRWSHRSSMVMAAAGATVLDRRSSMREVSKIPVRKPGTRLAMQAACPNRPHCNCRAGRRRGPRALRTPHASPSRLSCIACWSSTCQPFWSRRKSMVVFRDSSQRRSKTT